MILGLEPVPRSSLSDAVFNQLSAQILAGRIAPGSALPPERELAQSLGVNRGAVREGLKRLAQAGLVDQRHGGGTTVLDFRRHAGLGLLPQLLFASDASPDPEVAQAIMEMRAALAPDIAARCAARATAELNAALAEVIAGMRAVGPAEGDKELAALQLHSLELWELLAQGSGNIAYRLAFNTLRRTYEQLLDVLRIPLAEELRQVEPCAELVAAVAAGDAPRARELARDLMRLGSEGMQAALELLAHISAPPDPTGPDNQPDSQGEQP